MEENLQFQLKIIIEAVLKDLDGGKIDSVNVADVLCQSGNTMFFIAIAFSARDKLATLIICAVSQYVSNGTFSVRFCAYGHAMKVKLHLTFLAFPPPVILYLVTLVM